MKDLEEYAKKNKIPIMQKDGILYLINYIKENNIENILEIGSAIGYSSIMMASINKNIKVTTIEKDTVRYLEAVSNIQKYNLNKQIKIINKDATEVEINDKFDLIFIDASNGTIITDNLSFHGLVEDESLIKTKNQRGIVNKIKDFKSFLDNNEEFKTIYIPVGDTLAISKRRDENE